MSYGPSPLSILNGFLKLGSDFGAVPNMSNFEASGLDVTLELGGNPANASAEVTGPHRRTSAVTSLTPSHTEGGKGTNG